MLSSGGEGTIYIRASIYKSFKVKFSQTSSVISKPTCDKICQKLTESSGRSDRRVNALSKKTDGTNTNKPDNTVTTETDS